MHRVLFVDDDPNMLLGLRRCLGRFGDQFDAQFFDRGTEVLNALEHQDFDVIVSDMDMPEINGAELLSEIKRRHPSTLRVVLTGNSGHQAILDAIGPTHQFLGKPVEPTLLVDTLTRLCQLKDNLQDPRAFALVGSLEGLPTPSPIITQTLALLEDPGATSGAIAKLVGQDPSLTAQVLRLVSSPYFGFSRPIQDLKHAITVLGASNLRLAILSAGILSGFSQKGWVGNLIRQERAHISESVVVARSQGGDAGRLLMAGMLAHLGILVLASRAPGYRAIFEAAPDHAALAALEVEAYGADHAAVGSFLLGVWGVDWDIVQAVAKHDGSPSDEDPWLVRMTQEVMNPPA